ncbi:MAG TPA: carboxypeptidase-like regulatory domain-containing protein [Gemmatimonadaceae bacterium]|nr:carboxypeptidase-like regulatory domain-containing protein [Gemmatimonadaceae bacterium]
MHRALIVFVACLVALPDLASAQIVRGRVLETSSRSPVGGAVVWLLDNETRRVGSALTDDQGRFAISAPAGGEFTLEVKRIGVTRVSTPAFSLAQGATLERDVEVATIPAVQPEVRVSGRSHCGTKLAEGPALAELWEDLRAALTATQLTQQQKLLRVKTSVYSRRLDARGQRVISEERHEKDGMTESPFVAVSPKKLSRSGYVDSLGADAVIYYGPDATVLTSDEFVRDHCFKVIRGEGAERNWLGVEFEPVPRRTLPDVEGVLWVDAASRELRRIDYAYTTHRNLRGNVTLGGRVEFARMPPGTWIVSRWWIRMPQLTLVAGPMLPGVGRTKEPKVVGVQEDGGEVVTASAQGQTIRPNHQ